MTEPLSNHQAGAWTLLPLLAAGLLTACEYGEVRDPWVSGGQYEQERSRSPQTADELRHRVLYNQIDR